MSKEKWPPLLLTSTDKFVDSNQPDIQLNACIGPQVTRGRETHYYSDGFKFAAHRLVEQLVAYKTLELPVDVAVYPILFLYRHHIELLLKLQIIAGRNFVSEKAAPPHGHALNKLWDISRPLIERCFVDADWSQNKVVTSLLAELSSFDPNGEAARYPENKKGLKHFEDIALLNVRHFAEVTERLSEYLTTILNAIEMTHDQRMEYEAEMKAEMMNDYRRDYY